MFGSWILDVAIGLIVVFILFSTLCATVREGIEAMLKTRAAFLERGIRELLNDTACTDLAKKFYEHPLIFCLYAGEYDPRQKKPAPGLLERGRNLPSYIPSQNFALALMDIAARGAVERTPQNGAAPKPAPAPLTLASLRANVGSIRNEPVTRALVSAIDTAQGDLDLARRNIEQWFDSSMDRVSGWYRRKTNFIVFFIGLVLAALFNIDVFAIADHLYRNETDRAEIVRYADSLRRTGMPQPPAGRSDIITQQAAALVQAAPGSTGDASSSGTRTVTPIASSPLLDESLHLPIGWTKREDYGLATDTVKFNRALALKVWPLMIAGWLVTALAATLGAPFWFDVLNKFIIVRSTVKSYEKSPEKGSKERLSPSAPAPLPVQPHPDPDGIGGNPGDDMRFQH